TTKSDEGGTGLGLFISKNIIEALGGKIWAENNSGGKGATFSFSLPINQKK
ncbi:MAG: ATP-binding protein, partial [Nitrososphaeraceae archaeon]